MFPREQRIHGSQRILSVLRRGERRFHGCVVCYYQPLPVGTRIAVIVDSKVAPRAVDRNLLKRQVRSALRELTLRPGLLIVRLQKGALGKPYKELEQELRRCLQKLPS